MRWHTLSIPQTAIKNKRSCKCGKGSIYTVSVITAESEYPPFERGYDYTETNCPDNCEQCTHCK